ncbi:Tn3 family transposase [Micromonospora sp. NPDC049645]|uniref:Tn3 family transposase n=1 Tax=Micromonospora sp. NPDC049645 TaxID=3155508 RepID=UPI003413E4DA
MACAAPSYPLRAKACAITTSRDTLHFADLVFNPDNDHRPDVLITDQGSYSDIVFAIVTLLGFDYRPVLADLPDAKLWRINRGADYAALDRAARGTIDLDRIARHWPDILRVICSIYTRTVAAHEVIRMLQRDGRATQLGEAFAAYGRIFRTLHVLTFVDDPAYRRETKAMRNLNEGRHDLATAHLPRPPRRAAPRLPRRAGEPTRRPRPRAQLRHPVEHRLPGPGPH